MKPVKPKTMPKALETRLRAVANGGMRGIFDPDPQTARTILAALEYERQRADKAEEVAYAAIHAGVTRAVREHDADFQREQTAAVVPKRKAPRRG